MILVMVGSTVFKYFRRSDVGMGSSLHDLGAHLVTTECKKSVVIGMEYYGIQYHGYKVKQAHAMFRSQVDS